MKRNLFLALSCAFALSLAVGCSYTAGPASDSCGCSSCAKGGECPAKSAAKTCSGEKCADKKCGAEQKCGSAKCGTAK